MQKALFFFLLITLPGMASLKAQYYYPPSSGPQWDTVSSSSLGWCPEYWSEVESYLDSANSKSFIVLHQGRIVRETYFDQFQRDSLWYWASAGKTLMAFLIGLAQEETFLNLEDLSSDYLDTGWTNAPLAKENLIKVRHQMEMTTGLDYLVPDQNCTADSCLNYRRDAGQQWFYHNAPYLLLHDVLEEATGISNNLYTIQQLHQQIGFSGFWSGTIYISTARAMARFGHLLLSKGQWAGQPILRDSNFIDLITTPSQNLNPAYGYLTWLNGQSSYISPGLPFSFQGPLVPAAPADLYMAAGKNDQRIYVVPSYELVVVRQGNAADSVTLALSGFDNELWQRLMKVICTQPIGLTESKPADFSLYPQPAQDELNLGAAWSERLELIAPDGRQYALENKQGRALIPAGVSAGFYWLRDPSGHTAPVLIR